MPRSTSSGSSSTRTAPLDWQRSRRNGAAAVGAPASGACSCCVWGGLQARCFTAILHKDTCASWATLARRLAAIARVPLILSRWPGRAQLALALVRVYSYLPMHAWWCMSSVFEGGAVLRVSEWHLTTACPRSSVTSGRRTHKHRRRHEFHQTDALRVGTPRSASTTSWGGPGGRGAVPARSGPSPTGCRVEECGAASVAQG